MSTTETSSFRLDMHASLDHLLKTEHVFSQVFYPTFMAKFPEIREYFQGVNLQRLVAILPMALSVIYQFDCHHYAATRKYLEYVGSHHSLRGIPPEAYPKFREALLGTLAQVLGGMWHPELEDAWRQAIDKSIAVMLSAYGTRITI